MADSCRDVVDLRPVGQFHRSLPVPGSAEDSLPDLVHSALGQASEAEDLAFVQFKADAVQLARYGHLLYGQHNLVGNRRAIVRPVIGRTDLTADHQALQVVLRHLGRLDCVDILAVPQYGYRIRMGQHFAQVVADEDHRTPVLPDGVHDLVQLQAAVLAQCGRGLVDHEDLRLHIRRLDDLDQLPVLKVVVVDHDAGLDPAESVGIQQFLRFPVHGAAVLDAHVHEGFFMAQVNVFCHGQAGQGTHFLDDDGDSRVVRVHLVADMEFLAVQFERTAADRVDTAQHLAEGTLSGAVLADQAADLAGCDGQGYVVHRVGDAKAFVDMLCNKQRLLIHTHPPHFTTLPRAPRAVRATMASNAAPVTTFWIVVGAPSATNPLKIMEMMNSPITMALIGIPYFRNATPKKVPISGWKFRLIVVIPVRAVIVVP